MSYAYLYLDDSDRPCATCPDCRRDWRRMGGISIEFAAPSAPGPWYVGSFLCAPTGKLVDVSGEVASGLHSATRCGGCGEMLIDLPGVCEHVGFLERPVRELLKEKKK